MKKKANWFKRLIFKTKQKSPEILFGIGVVGVIAIPILSARATMKAQDKIDDYMESLKEDEAPDKKDLAREVIPCYIPTAIVCTTTVLAFGKSKGIVNGRLMSALSLLQLERSRTDILKEKIKEVVGPAKAEDIISAANVEAHKRNLDDKGEFINDCKVIETGLGETLFFDRTTATYFRCSLDAVDKAVNTINRRLTTTDIYASLNDFLEQINLPWMGIGENNGWVAIDEPLTVEKDYTTYKGEPLVVISYVPYPLYNYMVSEF